MELEIPLLLKIIAGFLTVGGVFFFKDYEKHIGRMWAVILLLFTVFLTISSLSGYGPREVILAARYYFQLASSGTLTPPTLPLPSSAPGATEKPQRSLASSRPTSQPPHPRTTYPAEPQSTIRPEGRCKTVGAMDFCE